MQIFLFLFLTLGSKSETWAILAVVTAFAADAAADGEPHVVPSNLACFARNEGGDLTDRTYCYLAS